MAPNHGPRKAGAACACRASLTGKLIHGLRELDVKNVVVTGTWTNACVQHTTMGAFCRGYDATILTDCCSCPDEGEHNHALAYMKKFYGAQAVNSAMWMKNFDAKPTLSSAKLARA